MLYLVLKIKERSTISFIAKFYLVKMFPRKDALTIDGDLLKIKFVNVINEILMPDVPDDVTQHFDLKCNGNPVLDPSTQDTWKKSKIVWQGKEWNLENYKGLKDMVIPVGDVVEIHVPNPGLSSGDKVTLEFFIKQDRPIKFKIQRAVA